METKPSVPEGNLTLSQIPCSSKSTSVSPGFTWAISRPAVEALSLTLKNPVGVFLTITSGVWVITGVEIEVRSASERGKSAEIVKLKPSGKFALMLLFK